MAADERREHMLQATSSDPTAAAPAAADETLLAPTLSTPETNTSLAWSVAEQPFEYPPIMHSAEAPPAPHHKPAAQHTAIIVAVLTLALVVVTLALCIVDLGVRRSSRESAPQAAPPPPSVAAAPVPPAPTAPPSSTSPPTVAQIPNTDRVCPTTPKTQYPDTEFVSIVEQSGLCIYDPPPMIALGHQVCGFLAQPGHTVNDALGRLDKQYLEPVGELTAGMVYGIVHGAVTAYCPEFTNQL